MFNKLRRWFQRASHLHVPCSMRPVLPEYPFFAKERSRLVAPSGTLHGKIYTAQTIGTNDRFSSGDGLSFFSAEQRTCLGKPLSKKTTWGTENFSQVRSQLSLPAATLTIPKRLGPGATSWKLFDLFGGCLCTRKAWEAIAAAAAEMWGVKCALSFDFVASCSEQRTYYVRLHTTCLVRVPTQKSKVEWHRSCQSFIKTMYPEACIFGDIMDLVQDTSVPVGSMKLVRTAWCAQHEQECFDRNKTFAL